MEGRRRTEDELTERIAALIPGHPEILGMRSPFALFGVEGFVCDDLDPSFVQLVFALETAQKMKKGGV